MGNPSGDTIPYDAMARGCAISRLYSRSAWIEGEAIRQLDEVAARPGMIELKALPDLHPGKYAPVGMVGLADRLYPQLIGNDIGCGMSLFELDLPLRKFKPEKAADQLRKLEAVEPDDPAERLETLGMDGDYFAAALGTIGGGNHFCEVQAVDDAGEAGPLDRQRLHLLVHSGSRSLGASIFTAVVAANGAMHDGLEIGTDAAVDYMLDHDSAVAWASLNRQMIAERAAYLLRSKVRLLADVPHNLVRLTDRGVAHYKGAAYVEPGALAPVAGSRATLSHVVRALDGVEGALGGISHGAGRKYDRRAMHGRVGGTKSDREALAANAWGGIAICDDRNLLVEEAAGAYKDAGKVVADLEGFGLVEAVAAMRPLVTYKSVLTDMRERERSKSHDRSTIRRMSHD